MFLSSNKMSSLSFPSQVQLILSFCTWVSLAIMSISWGHRLHRVCSEGATVGEGEPRL